MSDTVIKVENLSKHYNLGTIGSGTLYRDIQSFWARLRGKEDPNTQIGTWDVAQMEQNNSFWALKDVSFEVKQGDVVGIIGRNGAGKSTLLKILSKVTGPTSGNIKIKGRVASLLEVGTGFHPELTGRENVYLNGTILGMRKSEIDKKFDEIVAFAEIEKFIDTPVKRYSSGMYVRLAFAVAAHLDPEILIVDEVLAVGDFEFQKKCLGKMNEVSKAGRTVLFVSHNMTAVGDLCNKGILLQNGMVKEIDKIDKIITKYISGKSITSSAEAIFEGINDKVGLARISITDLNNKIQDVFKMSEKIKINICISVQEPIKNVDLSIWMRDSAENTIFFSSISDIEKNCISFTKGEYVCSVVIPNDFLLPDKYFLLVKLHEPNIRTVDYSKDQVSFLIEQTSKKNIYQYDDGIRNKYGYVAVNFPWDIHKFK